MTTIQYCFHQGGSEFCLRGWQVGILLSIKYNENVIYILIHNFQLWLNVIDHPITFVIWIIWSFRVLVLSEMHFLHFGSLYILFELFPTCHPFSSHFKIIYDHFRHERLDTVNLRRDRLYFITKRKEGTSEIDKMEMQLLNSLRWGQFHTPLTYMYLCKVCVAFSKFWAGVNVGPCTPRSHSVVFFFLGFFPSVVDCQPLPLKQL